MSATHDKDEGNLRLRDGLESHHSDNQCVIELLKTHHLWPCACTRSDICIRSDLPDKKNFRAALERLAGEEAIVVA